jgi:hypothetical protein
MVNPRGLSNTRTSLIYKEWDEVLGEDHDSIGLFHPD